MAAVNPQRTIDDLKALRALTGDEEGAQRVAWTATWRKAREWLVEQVKGLPIEVETDQAGNMWYTLRGRSPRALLIGGHIDSVPNGGWLDGCLNVLAGIEILRRLAAEDTPPPLTVRVVDWADEEGARFGRSLFGSSACSGTLNPDELRHLKDKDGILLVDALADFGVNLDTAKECGQQLKTAAAYLELHIEQGPVLEGLALPLGVVLGTFGVERHAITFRGQAAHSGSTPMNKRRDALAGAAKLSLEIREIAKRHGMGVCTVGSVTTKPGIVTSVVAECTMTLDQRHLDPAELAAMYAEAKAASEKFAQEENISVEWKHIWQIEPLPFHPHLLDLCEEAIMEVAGVSHRLPSGPLHDAAEMARVQLPTVMMFTQSLYGISHNKIEDTKEEHLIMAVQAFDKLASKALAWLED